MCSTTKTAAGRSAGSVRASVTSGSTPPADAPTTMRSRAPFDTNAAPRHCARRSPRRTGTTYGTPPRAGCHGDRCTALALGTPEQAGSAGGRDGLEPGVGAEGDHDRRDVVAHRRRREPELAGDLLRREALGHQQQDLVLARCQAGLFAAPGERG